MDYQKVKFALALILLQLLLSQVPQISGRPGKLYGLLTTEKPSRGCVEDSEVTLCQQCAKATKSAIVYPMCCVNEEDARLFCIRYLEFGLGNSNQDRTGQSEERTSKLEEKRWQRSSS